MGIRVKPGVLGGASDQSGITEAGVPCVVSTSNFPLIDDKECGAAQHSHI